MVLGLDDPSVKTPVGEVVRIPVKFIKGKSDTSAIVISAIATQLQTVRKNVLPVMVKVINDDQYQAIYNTHILEAARQAKLDFIWCIAVDAEMQSQMQVETGQRVQVSLRTASEKTLCDAIDYARSQVPSLNKLNAALIARAIVDYRKTNEPKNLAFLTKLRCGIGKTKLLPLAEYLTV